MAASGFLATGGGAGAGASATNGAVSAAINVPSGLTETVFTRLAPTASEGGGAAGLPVRPEDGATISVLGAGETSEAAALAFGCGAGVNDLRSTGCSSWLTTFTGVAEVESLSSSAPVSPGDCTVDSLGGATFTGAVEARITGGALGRPGTPNFMTTAPPAIKAASAVKPATLRYHELARAGGSSCGAATAGAASDSAPSPSAASAKAGRNSAKAASSAASARPPPRSGASTTSSGAGSGSTGESGASDSALGIRTGANSTTLAARGRSAASELTSRVNSESGSSTSACGALAARSRRSNSSRLISGRALPLLMSHLAGRRRLTRRHNLFLRAADRAKSL